MSGRIDSHVWYNELTDWVSRLDAYYRLIHIYLPILPPPPQASPGSDSTPPPTTDSPKYSASSPGSESPLRLAIKAILMLVPHPSVSNPSRPSYVVLRRRAADQLVHQCLQMIEDESDMPEGLPLSTALAHTSTRSQRKSLHPDVPMELEAVLALCLLAIYEYTQRGNIRKMRDRAGQALVYAMDMSLHCMSRSEKLHAEAKKRAWWMTVSIFPSARAPQCGRHVLTNSSLVHLLLSSINR